VDPYKEIWEYALWQRNELSWKLHDGQKLIDNAYRKVTAKLFVANCSRRIGKTYWIVMEAIRVARSKDRARVKIATAFLTDLEEFIVPSFDAVLENCPDAFKPYWAPSKKKFVFKNKSEIQLIGLDRKPNAGRGNYCDLYIFDEAAFINNVSYIYSSVVVPMTMYRDGAKVVMISTPPKSPDHDFRDFCIKAKRENAYIELDIYKNPMVTPKMIEEYHAECLTETDWEREYLCKFATDATLSIVPEMRNYNYKRAEKDDNYNMYHKYVAMDLGVRDLNFTVFAYYDFKRAKVVIEREHVISGPTMTTPILKSQLEAIEKELWNGLEPYKRVADNNNPLLLLDLGSIHGMFFHSTSKDSLHAMVNNMRVWFSHGRIEIDDSCIILIDSLKYGLWNEKRSEFSRSKTLGHYDAIAALMYLLRNIDESTNPIPLKLGFSQVNTEEDDQLNEYKKLINYRRK
jgi:hypothetical protein